MTAYAVFIQDRTRNAAELQTYTEMLRPLLAGSGGTLLAAHGPQDILEGAAPEGVVMVSFPTMEAARTFYDSSDYQAAVRHRFLGGDYRSFIIGGIS
ncbi:DUF1330 domain-containing protein [Agrobacterium tumefaciens]|jgi:uncharacterized protein (DUF1330 family)|uniref:Uncharacterized protein (DUF1330 family) n=1 Tax=Agrobacterium tumefaciens TaxID=358 RepID=A0AAW8M0H9_AGRTU|nr:DUF1330 domain-containing protein [Agrobacterium tumefaciens]MBP2542462.1 uncharacterized protein (DUF1330 family) [Agrobacterium tumefaciens]MBP2567989.1 uncharacterized protein (DUF1330 family) [Agrobacterium tumefaciens]MDP9874099.1 uncharacterized protein (DUF1330 family) [Agrobacterium tumefaciens]MDP9978695.1 uncharacterized protein (DUF1330 family) [Agrobacterium tumefaciens]MDR6704914.1 uncharacterized protein (DUF1330 family) [Agrobacterium tumefaciens]